MADVDNNDLDIYINNDDDFIEDELTIYLDEKSVTDVKISASQVWLGSYVLRTHT
jgi:hypothetical protein